MKKLLSLLLTLILLLPAMAVFGEEAREQEGNLFVTGLPIVAEPESFSILVDESGTVEDKIMLPILQEQTGVDVEWMIYPYEMAKERKNILLASGDYPDVVAGWLLGDNDILTDGMVEGVYIPLEDLIEKYSPKMKEILEIPGVRANMTLPDGHIYTIPYVIEEPLVSFLPFINMEWLKNVNMEMPTTTEELREVLRAFKEQDANGNGDPNDEIPFSADPNNMNLGQLAGWFGVNAYGGGNDPYFAMVDGKIDFQANKEGYKEFVKYFASLYAEGLVDPELYTQDLELWKSKGRQGLYGVSIAYGSNDFYEPDVATNRTPYDPLPVLKSDFTDKPIFRRNGFGVSLFRTQVAITDKAKNPALIIRWFDNVFDLDNSVQIQNGLFGVKMEKLEDGSYRRLDDTKLSEEDLKKHDWANMFMQSLPKYLPVGLKIAPPEGLEEKYDDKKAADKVYEAYLEEQPLPKTWMSAEDAERAATIQTDIKSYCDQKLAEWVSGEKDIEAEWDGYVAQLEKLGLAELTQLKQKAIDALPQD